MPNLIFKRINSGGKTIEEIEQICLLKFKEGKRSINDFVVFYHADYSKNPFEYKVVDEGMILELETNNLYFIEIKKSLEELKLSYENLKNKNLEINTSKQSSRFKRENLTDLSNSILTVNNFAKLIEEITDTKYIINLLYIVNDDCNLDIIQMFNACLKRDEKVIEQDNIFKIKLIYTQSDLFIQNWIEENNKKNKLFKSFEEIIEENQKTIKEIKLAAKKNEERYIYLENKFNHSFHFLDIDTEIIEFCKNIENPKELMTIGIKEIINNNHSYKFTSLHSVSSFSEKTLKKDYYLIDLVTFNCVEFQKIENEFLFNIYIENYKKDISLCEKFNDVYLLVDYAFMNNFSNIINKNILNNYAINIYMFEKEYFMIHLKRDSALIESEIKFYKNKCLNPMLEEKSENISAEEVEEFASNYYNL